VAKKYDLDPEEARNWRLAKLFDLRSFIGVLFVIFGVLVTISGVAPTQAELDKAAGINLALWVGGMMLAFGLLFLLWPCSPAAAGHQGGNGGGQAALEEMGTSGGQHH
jgi:hypothetical protein